MSNVLTQQEHASLNANLPTKDKSLDLIKQSSKGNVIQLSDNTSHTTFDTQNLDTKNEKLSLRSECLDIASKLGFSLASRGTHLIVEAVLYLYENNIDRFEIKDIYKILEQKYQTNLTKVQDNIRKAIKGKCIKFKIKQTDNQIINFFRTHDFTPKLVIILGVYKLRKMYPPAGYDDERIERILYSIC